MEWYPYKFQSRTDIKSGGRKRSKRERDVSAAKAFLDILAPMVIGYGANYILASMDKTKPMRVFMTKEGRATLPTRRKTPNKIPMRV